MKMRYYFNHMARFSIVRHCPLCVQFWLYGLDAQRGDLGKLGYVKHPSEQGSSVYASSTLELHSAFLVAHLPEGKLRFERRTGRFTLNGDCIAAPQGRALLWPLLMEHESKICKLHGKDWRQKQLAAHKLPPPIRRNVTLWQEYTRPLDLPITFQNPS